MTAAIFDLDDTLIDTRNVLLPAALRRLSAALGVPVECLDPRGKKLEEVTRRLPPLTAEQRERGAAAWYSPDVPPLDPLPGAREVLEALKGHVLLVLLTRGDPHRQRRKIERSGLGPVFDEILIRGIESAGSKRDDIEGLMRRRGLTPDRTVVIGDDARDEIAHARALGCRAILVPETPLAAIPGRLAEWGWLGPDAGSPADPGST